MKSYVVNGKTVYKTRRGYLVKILSSDVKSKFNYVGLIVYPSGEEVAGQWNSLGKFANASTRYKFKAHALDLI